MSGHLRIRHYVAAYSKMKYKFFVHQDEKTAREPNNIQRLRKCANKNIHKANPKKD